MERGAEEQGVASAATDATGEPSSLLLQKNIVGNTSPGVGADDLGPDEPTPPPSPLDARKRVPPPPAHLSSPACVMADALNRGREGVLRRLRAVMFRGTLTMIDLSQRFLRPSDGSLIRRVMSENPSLSVLKLGYNALGDIGAAQIAEGLRGHPTLAALDLGFNGISDAGCIAVAGALAPGGALATLYLSGNAIGGVGAAAIAEALRGGCGVRRLHLTANGIGPLGVTAIAGAAANIGENSGLRELYAGGTEMGAEGCRAVSDMVGASESLQVLNLSDNCLGDDDLTYLAAAISGNKAVPLEVIQLSFNSLTCVGVESLMNGIWGSPTLREVRLDNNRIGDRGAQLVAVVSTSVDLEILDLGFNNLSPVGIKALMKALANNSSLQSLTLSGNPLDTGASKAVAYALAYNRSLRSLFVDNCSVTYAAQRHIAAGIVSNSQTSLSTLTGYRLGAIAVTLGLPSALDQLTNDQVLTFIRYMWERRESEMKQKKEIVPRPTLTAHSGAGVADDDGVTTAEESSGDDNIPSLGKKGPLDPATVVAVAKCALAALGEDGMAGLPVRPRGPGAHFESPLVDEGSIMIEKQGGIAHVSSFKLPNDIELDDTFLIDDLDVWTDLEGPIGTLLPLEGSNIGQAAISVPLPPSITGRPNTDPTRKQKNIEWLCQHTHELHELSKRPLNQDELDGLQQYFCVPQPNGAEPCVYDGDLAETTVKKNILLNPSDAISSDLDMISRRSSDKIENSSPYSKPISSVHLVNVSCDINGIRKKSHPHSNEGQMTRKLSYRSLSNAVISTSPIKHSNNSNFNLKMNDKRRIISVTNEEGFQNQCSQPRAKRPRNSKARIDYFPRIKEVLDESLSDTLSDTSQLKALVLMRQLFFIEKVLFQGKDIYSEAVLPEAPPHDTSPADAEIIVLNILSSNGS
mmetsp:Transcript_46545/g.90948  ORF Transcript_46545/g.90948 Transcript_46545/m.90948 type:complete len:918 (+) Transcript_46545:35-2788(+)